MMNDVQMRFREEYGDCFILPPGDSLDDILFSGNMDMRRRNFRYILWAGQDGDYSSLLERASSGCFIACFDGITLEFTFLKVHNDRGVVVEILKVY